MQTKIPSNKYNDQQLLYTIESWVKRYIDRNYAITAIKGDAGSRKYFRIFANNNYIVMYDPDEIQFTKYIAYNIAFAKSGIIVPKVMQYSLKHGFLLQEDFGENLLAQTINKYNMSISYKACINNLLKMQQSNPIIKLEEYENNLLIQEMQLANTWYFAKHHNNNLNQNETVIFDNATNFLCEVINSQPQVLVHRDYHSRNIFCLEHGVAVIDFQDAISGAATYDLASLLRDYYSILPQQTLDELIKYYYQQASEKNIISCSFSSFNRWFYCSSVQRHLKVLGIFCRLNYRDNKPHYLQYLPTVLKYLQHAATVIPETKDIIEIISSLELENAKT